MSAVSTLTKPRLDASGEMTNDEGIRQTDEAELREQVRVASAISEMVDRALRRSMLSIVGKAEMDWHRPRSGRSTKELVQEIRAGSPD